MNAVDFHVRRFAGGRRGHRLGGLRDLSRLRVRDAFDLRLGGGGFRHALFRAGVAPLVRAAYVAAAGSATIVAYAAIFLAVLIPLSFISHRFSREREEFAGRRARPRRWASSSAWCAVLAIVGSPISCFRCSCRCTTSRAGSRGAASAADPEVRREVLAARSCPDQHAGRRRAAAA